MTFFLFLKIHLKNLDFFLKIKYTKISEEKAKGNKEMKKQEIELNDKEMNQLIERVCSRIARPTFPKVRDMLLVILQEDMDMQYIKAYLKKWY